VFFIGINMWANHWMGTFNRNQYQYPDTAYGANGMIDHVAESASDKFTSRRIMVSDIMQDLRSRREVLQAHGVTGSTNLRPLYSFNSHGGRTYFAGGNVGYADGAVRWRSRIQCENNYVDDYRSYMVNRSGPPRGWDSAGHTEAWVRYLNVCATDMYAPSGDAVKPMNFYW
jgi:hypothetical protein